MIDEPEDWHVRRKRFDAFTQTELGQLYKAYEQALTAYGQADPDQEPQKTMSLDEMTRDTTHAFITKLMELAGV